MVILPVMLGSQGIGYVQHAAEHRLQHILNIGVVKVELVSAVAVLDRVDVDPSLATGRNVGRSRVGGVRRAGLEDGIFLVGIGLDSAWLFLLCETEQSAASRGFARAKALEHRQQFAAADLRQKA